MNDEQHLQAVAIRPPFRVEWTDSPDPLLRPPISKHSLANRVYSLCLLFFMIAITPPDYPTIAQTTLLTLTR